MEIYTIGFVGRTAEDFFGSIRSASIARLVDVRLNNSSQLAGFTKSRDLGYFLKDLCNADYVEEKSLAPTEDLLKAYRTSAIDWQTYEEEFLRLLAARRVEETLSKSLFENPTVLLCSERTSEKCHRRLIVEYLSSKWGQIRRVDL